MAKPWHSLLMLENRRWSRQAFGNTPKAQCAFKSLLIHEILLFSMLITLCCTLHHHPSQDIQCWKLWWHKGLTPWKQKRRQWVCKAQWCPNTAAGRQQAAYLAMADIPECMWGGSIAAHPHKRSQHQIIVLLSKRCANDPSAGSPTETLLRLLLPLSDKVH